MSIWTGLNYNPASCSTAKRTLLLRLCLRMHVKRMLTTWQKMPLYRASRCVASSVQERDTERLNKREEHKQEKQKKKETEADETDRGGRKRERETATDIMRAWVEQRQPVDKRVNSLQTYFIKQSAWSFPFVSAPSFLRYIKSVTNHFKLCTFMFPLDLLAFSAFCSLI